MTDITKIFPETKRLTVTLKTGATDEIEFTEFTLGQLPAVIRLSKSIYGSVSTMLSEQRDMSELISYLIAEGGDEFFELIGLSIKRPRAWFDTVGIDDGIDIITGVIQVNMTFFVQRVLPKFKTSMEGLRALSSAGLTPSPN